MGLFRSKAKGMNYLEMTPFRKHSERVSSGGIVTVLVPRFSNRIVSRLLSRSMPDPWIHTELDEIGSRVWLAIDGRLPVSEIINKVSAEMGDKVHPATDRITQFLTQLYRSGFISFKELTER